MDKEALLTIGRPHRLCMNCNAPIDAIEHHPSAVRPAGKAKLERLDYCPECWQAIKDEVYESYWITRREVRDRRPKLTRRQRSLALRALFESLWDRRDQEDVSAQIYMLSHLLMKWGGLRWRENRAGSDGREIVVFEDAASGQLLEIPGVEMDDTMMALVNQEIEDFLRQYQPEDAIEL